tara:strand:+ start:2095 stop:2916 length:822 start_codon:yes stop_codon:yes gene_type:complete
MSNLTYYKNAVNKLKELENNSFLTEKEIIESLENHLVCEIENIIETELKEFSDNFFETADYMTSNDLDGVDFHKDISALNEKLKEYPADIIETSKDNFIMNFSGYFDENNYIQSTSEDNFITHENKIIINGTSRKIYNDFHAQLLSEFCACKNGMIGGLYYSDYYGNISKFESKKLPIELLAFNTDDNKTINKLAQILSVYDLFIQQNDTYTYIYDLYSCFNHKDKIYNSFNHENEFEIELHTLEIEENTLKIQYTNLENKESLQLNLDIREL